MKEIQTNPSRPVSGHTAEVVEKGFRKATWMLFVFVLSAIVGQFLFDWLAAKGMPALIPFLPGLAVLGVFLGIYRKPLYRMIDTPYFAISGLIAIALGTALGTFVTQNTPFEVFTQRYGVSGSTLLRNLQLHDVFHSWWYAGLYLLLAGSLLKIALKRPFNSKNLGFHLAHLGPIIVLAGFYVDYFLGFRGIIQLEIGQQKQTVMVYDGPTNYIKDSTNLDFFIRLDTFAFEKYEPDYRIQVWKRPEKSGHPGDAVHVNEKTPEIMASLPLTPMEIHRVYGSDIYFRLVEFFPNFFFDYTYPEVTDTIEPRDPGVQLEVKTPIGDGVIQLLANKPGRNKIADIETMGAWVEFYWDLPESIQSLVERGSPLPEVLTTNRIILAGNSRQIYFMVGDQLTVRPMETGVFYDVPEKENVGFFVKLVYPDAAYLNAVPSTLDDELLNPVAKLEVWRKGGPAKEAFVYPGGQSRKSGMYNIPDSRFLLALESIKDMETKYYRSRLSVVSPEGAVLHQQAIKVNEPMLYGGHRFYQSDYNPENPDYSGIGVSHEPGLYVIYFGFVVLTLGCLLMFYFRENGAHA